MRSLRRLVSFHTQTSAGMTVAGLLVSRFEGQFTDPPLSVVDEFEDHFQRGEIRPLLNFFQIFL